MSQRIFDTSQMSIKIQIQIDETGDRSDVRAIDVTCTPPAPDLVETVREMTHAMRDGSLQAGTYVVECLAHQEMRLHGTYQDRVFATHLLRALTPSICATRRAMIQSAQTLPTSEQVECAAREVLNRALRRLMNHQPNCYPRSNFLEVVSHSTYAKMLEKTPHSNNLAFDRMGTHTRCALSEPNDRKMYLVVMPTENGDIQAYFNDRLVEALKAEIGRQMRPVVEAYISEQRQMIKCVSANLAALEQIFELPTSTPSVADDIPDRFSRP